MKYLLDTNIVSYWMRGDESIISEIARRRPCDLSISLITYAEICYGIEKSPIKKKERKEKLDSIVSQIEIIPMDIDAAHKYAEIRVLLENRGTVISERDLQIAAIARSQKLCLITHNTREFERVPDLAIENWYKID